MGGSAFRQIRERLRIFPESVDSQLPSAQNYPYAKVACSGMALSTTLQNPDVIPGASAVIFKDQQNCRGAVPDNASNRLPPYFLM